LFGARLVMTGEYVNRSAATTGLIPPWVVTRTSTVPRAWAGDLTVIRVAELTVTPVPGIPSKLTVAGLVNPVPTIVTVVPPPTGPVAGVNPVTRGAVGVLQGLQL
jgi:hypothetical protein